MIKSRSLRATATAGIRCFESAGRVQVAGGFGIRVQGQVIEELDVRVQHEAVLGNVCLVVPNKLPLGG